MSALGRIQAFSHLGPEARLVWMADHLSGGAEPYGHNYAARLRELLQARRGEARLSEETRGWLRATSELGDALLKSRVDVLMESDMAESWIMHVLLRAAQRHVLDQCGAES